MLRETVISSNVAAVGHDAATNTLEVQFHPNKNGEAKVWAYTPVTADEHMSLKASSSIGKALLALRREPRIQEQHVETITAVNQSDLAERSF